MALYRRDLCVCGGYLAYCGLLESTIAVGTRITGCAWTRVGSTRNEQFDGPLCRDHKMATSRREAFRSIAVKFAQNSHTVEPDDGPVQVHVERLSRHASPAMLRHNALQLFLENVQRGGGRKEEGLAVVSLFVTDQGKGTALCPATVSERMAAFFSFPRHIQRLTSPLPRP
ncbi:hypothetical protein FIBSPDRAFT_901794 [Athelia psychrophila]|uniref:Uncharacterized protein n=1 Tax=Athelia psychrophila TaxID=1759441 RepID=A0A165WPG9_9AGAM|nr:hypothetical protein FIBSPDRAFT_901794 [Fibularhizoctonia sp. CBS 109695]